MSLTNSNPYHMASANLLCMTSMFVWAAGLPAAEMIIPLIPPLPLTALRTGLAAAVLMAFWIALEGWGPIRQANWRRGVATGFVCIGLGAVFLVIGQAYTDPVTVAIITTSMPLIGIGLEVGLDGRRITPGLIMGMALSLCGGLVAMAQAGFSLEIGLGALAVLASCATFTWGSRATVTGFPTLSPLGRTAVTVTGAFLAMSVISLGWDAAGGAPVNWAAIGWPEFGALVMFSVGSLAVSQILWIMSVERIGIGGASLHMNAVPFYVMLIAFSLGAPWNWVQTLGAAIVVLGVMIAQGGLRWPR